MPDMFHKLPPPEMEPKRYNRFKVEFPELFRIPPYFIQSAKKPSWVNGKWQNMDITLIDPIGPSMTEAVMDLIEYCDLMKGGLFSKKPIFSYSIIALDATGVEVEKWIIDVKELLSVDFGDYSYGSGEIQKISIWFKPLKCTLI
jgi:hypothetical protein